MWTSLRSFGLFRYLLIAFGIFLVLSDYFINFNGGFSFHGFCDFLSGSFKRVSYAAIFFMGIVFICGKWLWRLLWWLPGIGPLLNKFVCPNLNGTWQAEVVSNFTSQEVPEPISVNFTIKADFFGITMSGSSESAYQNSSIYMCEIYRDRRQGDFWLQYFYEGVVPNPLASDDRSFDGAAKLKISIDSANSITMEGMYWTNRASQRSMNTAGSIRMRLSSKG